MFKIGILIDGQNSKFWGVDFLRLIQYLLKRYQDRDPEIIIKKIYSSVKKESEAEKNTFLDFMEMIGYNVVKRVFYEGQKADVDAKIGSELRKYSEYCDLLVLLAGDGDYMPVLDDLALERGQLSLIITAIEVTSRIIKKEGQKKYSNIEVAYLDELGIYKDDHHV